MSWIALAMNVSPALAPSIGGFLGEQFGWRATFWFVGAFGALLLARLALFAAARPTATAARGSISAA